MCVLLFILFLLIFLLLHLNRFLSPLSIEEDEEGGAGSGAGGRRGGGLREGKGGRARLLTTRSVSPS